MNIYYVFLLLTCLYSCYTQPSSQASTSPGHYKINYIGTLNGKDVEYINISGLTDKIIFYEKPAQQNKDPKGIEIEKDLSDIKSITIAEGDAVAKYAGEYFVEVVVRDHVGNSTPLLIPQSKQARGHLTDNSWMNVSFGSLQKLDIIKADCGKKSEPKS
jgi:hypothetical protein